MNIRGLRAFCLVMQHGSLAGAAGAMNLSQPAVSRMVANLEASLHLELFHRDRRALRPTRQAQAFYKEATRILSGVERLPDIAQEISRGINATLRVVVMSRLALGLVLPAAKTFKADHPDVRLTLEMHHRRDIERWLAGRQFDLGFGPLPVNDASIEAEPLCSVGAVIVGATGRFETEQPVELRSIAREPMITLTPDTLLQGQIEALFALIGAEPNVALQTSSSLLACALAADGHGLTITDPFTARSTSGISYAPIVPAFPMEFGTLWPADVSRTQSALKFQECVVRNIGF